MTKCKCYHVNGGTTPIAVCYGTRECEPCWCDGYEENCTHYPEKRKKTFNTAEMWIQAQKDDETYIELDGLASYSNKDGFRMENLHIDNVMTLSDWLIKRWKVQERRVMTIEEAEKEFDIIIARK